VNLELKLCGLTWVLSEF